MIQIDETLNFDHTVELPVRADGFWFPKVVPGSNRLAAIVVWIANAAERGIHGVRLFRLNRNDSPDLVWVLSANDDPIECEGLSELGITPLVRWSGDTASGELWIPYNGRVEPVVRSDEREKLIADQTTSVWLPHVGLIRVEPKDRCQLEDFFRAPLQSDLLWQRAPEIEIQFPVIRQLQPSVPIQVNELLADGNDWIGQDAGSFEAESADDSPPVTEQAKRWVLKKMDQWSDQKKQKSKKPSERTPAKSSASTPAGTTSSSSPGWMGAISQSLAQRLSKRMQAERERQIEKLLSMLKSDPDRAIRFALPISGDGGFRGFSIPGAKLLERLPDFSLHGIRSGGAVDDWTLGYDLQSRLRESYQEQLHRAKTAGLHRRAAYIAAHLLGDFRMAATTLEEGGYFAEAAEVYLQKLNRPRDAARCLAQSGQWEQAVRLYRDVGEIEHAGDVLRDVGQQQQAAQAYRDAATRYQSSGRIFDAVAVMDKKLNCRDEAIELLWKEWPGSTQATAACQRAIEMLSDDGRHDEVMHRISWIAESGGVESTLAAAEVFKGIAKSSPDENVRVQAADACRVAAVRGMATASPFEVDQRMDLIGQLDDPFALLRRDARTFAKEFRQQKRLARASEQADSSSERSQWQLKRADTASMELDFVIYADVSGETVRALGANAGTTFLNDRSDTLRQMKSVRVDGLDLSLCSRDQFANLGRGSDPILLIGGRRERQTALPPQILDLEAAGLERLDFCVASRSGILSGLRIQDEITFVQGRFDDLEPNKITPHLVHDLTVFVETRMVMQLGETISELDIRLAVIGEHVFLFVGAAVALLTKNGPAFWGQIRQPIRNHVTSLPATRSRIAVIDDDGLVVYWLESSEFRQEVVADGDYSHVCLLRNGFVAVAGESIIEVFQSKSEGYVRSGSQSRNASSPIVSMLTWKHNGFMIVHRDGTVEHWTIDRAFA